jgi:hypothetical protein
MLKAVNCAKPFFPSSFFSGVKNSHTFEPAIKIIFFLNGINYGRKKREKEQKTSEQYLPKNGIPKQISSSQKQFTFHPFVLFSVCDEILKWGYRKGPTIKTSKMLLTHKNHR